MRVANKKAFEGLVLAGGFDSFINTHRAQYFAIDEKNQTFLERAIKFGHKFQESKNSAQVSLFGEASEVSLPEPTIPDCDTWGTMELLAKEKEVIGMYISAHPLDDFKNEMKFCSHTLDKFNNLKALEGHNFTIAGIITDVQHRTAKNGNGWGMFSIESYEDHQEFRLFGEDYLKFKHFLVVNSFLYIKGNVQKGWKQKDGTTGEPRIKFTEFSLLQDILDKLCKKITIKIPLEDVTEDLIKDLQHIFTLNSGTKNVDFVVFDSNDKIEVNLPSRNLKIDITSEFLDKLEKQHIRFKLN